MTPNALVPLTLSVICGLWIGVIAILATQNTTPLALHFLGLRSVPLPLGLILALGGILGWLGTSLILAVIHQASRE
jgi:uncharacterized integral membrane protein